MSTQTLQEQLYDGTNAVFLRLLTVDPDRTTPLEDWRCHPRV